MKVVLFGATGMVGQGVLRECLLDPDVERVLSIGRTATGQAHPKLEELVHADLHDLAAIEPRLAGADACFFCLGATSAGKTEAEYHRITFELTLAAARVLARMSPRLTFIYVSGAGTDSTEKGSTMWARVKGKTENALLQMPFKAAYMFRPGYIQPLHGAVSKTSSYRWIYRIMAPLYPVWRRLFPGMVTTTEHLGRAMLYLARRGGPKKILESRHIEEIGRLASQRALP